MTIPEGTLISSMLDNAYFSDTHNVNIRYEDQSALEIYMLMAQDTPRWVNSLMMLRNQIVSKMGLKHLGKMTDFSSDKPSNEYQIGDQLGIFSIYSLSHEEVILEDRDKHLDVRLSFFIEPNGGTATLHASSVVHVKNTFGKVYMFFVAPVHKLIVPATLKRLPLR
ncbi:DUF2867 domain-containing protein [Vibrio tapetis subsp. quintayensis]|uniref:DUF2867 domain-containing protein n=1 Tax=Vibrio tapetis TaxID=52443 RepID=UPI0025B4A00E|nr:DUF2867 domain-containing protein [Vibrio tapetis]MDN3678856.1 DUF2867 domain-containing protein [Vibrio tapetis subsp. quintayensis]